MEVTAILKAILAIFCTVLFFIVGLQVGKDHTRQLANRVDCPQPKSIGSQLRQKSISTFRRTKKKCPETNIETNVLSNVIEAKSQDGDTAMCRAFDLTKTKTLHMGKANVPEDIFSYLHHPASPAKSSIFFTLPNEWSQKEANLHGSECKEVYLTRSGSRGNQPNKCVALVVVPTGYESITQQSHRSGYTARNTDQYQQDYPRDYNNANEKPEVQLLLPFLRDRESLIAELVRKVGDPIDPKTGVRRQVIIMVANEGVMDLLLNFFCSAEQIDLDLSNIVVFVGDSKYQEVIEHMGGHAMFSPSLGSMPAKAAGYYLDHTFSRMMWFKTTSVYLALAAGYEVLFQDVDLVWLRNPFTYLTGLPGDMVFMDDGARTPRYTPFFVNSGFYYVKQNPRTVYMFESFLKAAPGAIGQTHSHQSVLIKHIAEAHHLFNLAIDVLDNTLFPSGQAYHENKPLIKKIVARKFRPYVFHMCWTDNRENKVTFFTEIEMWYLPNAKQDEAGMCTTGRGMLYSLQKEKNGQGSGGLLSQCCNRKLYWPRESQELGLVEGVGEIAAQPEPVVAAEAVVEEAEVEEEIDPGSYGADANEGEAKAN